MYFKTLTFLLIVSLAACNNDEKKPVPPVPEDKKPEVSQPAVFLFNPDTSIAGIKICDPESAAPFIDKIKMDPNDQYHFYSKKGSDILSMTKHPGDVKNSISIFSVRYSDKAYHKYERLGPETFETEKGIKLGLNKQDIIDRIGNHYTAKDSTKGYIELYYRLELPNDSKTKLLERHNMPIYYASYKLWNDKLGKFEFGFEYP